jgi:hypothetical protein
MHRDHNHHHHHDHRHGNGSGYELRPTPGHNSERPVQWQAPGRHHHAHDGEPEPDFDLVETAFAESFPRASDPTSFLRLARIPFVGRDADGRVLRLLRVEYEQVTDVGAVTPHLGGASLRYDPLPAALVSSRRRLRFAYQDGESVIRLSLAETRGLAEEGAAG